MFFFALPSLFRGGFVFFHIFFSMFSRVSEIYQKIINFFCWLYRIVIYICKVNKAQNKNINDMKAIHQTVAKTLRYSNYNAKCVFNGTMEQPYEVIVKGITRQEANKLQQMFCEMLKDSRINIINN